MDKKIDAVIHMLDIPKWFPDYDKTLLYLAFMPSDNKYHKGPIYQALTDRYHYEGHTTYQLLEYYGDQVYYMIIADIFRDFAGLKGTPNAFTNAKIKHTNNAYIRTLSHSHKICDTVYGIRSSANLSPHNVCSDSFEALLGALYMQYGLAGMPTITQWFVTNFSDVLNSVRKELAPYRFVPVNDGPYIIERFQDLNPGCTIKDNGTLFELSIDGLIYDRKGVLEDLIPIIHRGTLDKHWATKYKDLPTREESLCTNSASQYVCDSSADKRVSKKFERRYCPSAPAKGECNIVTDFIPAKALYTSCLSPPFEYSCDKDARRRVSKVSKSSPDCPTVEALGACNIVTDRIPARDLASSCHNGPYTYTCDAKGQKRVLKVSRNRLDCMPLPADGHCNLITDKISVRDLAESLLLTPRTSRPKSK